MEILGGLWRGCGLMWWFVIVVGECIDAGDEVASRRCFSGWLHECPATDIAWDTFNQVQAKFSSGKGYTELLERKSRCGITLKLHVGLLYLCLRRGLDMHHCSVKQLFLEHYQAIAGETSRCGI